MTEPESAPQPTLPQSSAAASPRVDAKSGALGLKEWISFLFSAIALVVSGLSFYFSNVRVADHASARVVDIQAVVRDLGEDNKDGIPTEFLILRLACTNDGNRPAVILSVWHHMHGRRNDSGIAGEVARADHDSFPLILQPHEVRVLNFRLPIERFLRLYDQASPLDFFSLAGERQRRLFGSLEFFTIDSRGRLHEARSRAVFTVDVFPKQLASYAPVENGAEHPPIRLFR